MAEAEINTVVESVTLTLSPEEAATLSAFFYCCLSGTGHVRTVLSGIAAALEEAGVPDYEFSHDLGEIQFTYGTEVEAVHA